MKRFSYFLVCFVILAVSAFALVGCGSGDGGTNGGTTEKTVVGVTFSDKTFDYDGSSHEILIEGELPEGVSAIYENNKGVNAGTYSASATLSGEGYKTLVLTATLTVNKLNYDMSGAAWDYRSPFTYDGQRKTVSAVGLPAGVSAAAYTDNAQTDAGEYTASVALDHEDKTNHNAPTMPTLKWRIEKAEITTAVEFKDLIVEYDARPHGIEFVGDLPVGVTAEVYYDDSPTEPTEPGEYSARLELSGKNYIEKTFEATLTIRSSEEQLYSYAAAGGAVYFQNALDGNRLYTVKSGKPVKVCNDVPNYMVGNGDSIYYFSKGLFSSAIKTYDGAGTSVLHSESGEYLASDGANLYYAVNNLLVGTDKNGIYRVSSSGGGTPTRITTDKAEYPVYLGGYVYYSNKSDKSKLYRVSATAANASGTLVYDDAVEYVVTDGEDVFFNAGSLLGGKAVFKYDLSAGKAVKLTVDSGKYLTVIGEYIYYVNNDKLTSELFGDGIYRVNKTSGSTTGEKIVSARDGDGYSSLSSDGADLYYYRLKDKHFYKNRADGNGEVDLMSGFVPPEETVTLSGYSTVAEHNGEIYYTDPRSGGGLYKYDPSSGRNVKVLADNVSKIYFHSDAEHDYMYYGTYIATNYSLRRLDLKTQEIVKITSKRIDNMIFEGGRIYGTRVGATGNEIVSMDLDGNDEQVVTDDGAPSSISLEKTGDTYYFINNPAIGYQYLCLHRTGDAKRTELHRSSNFAISGNKIYFYAHTDDTEDKTIKKNTLNICDLDGSNAVTVVTDVEITYMYSFGGKIYFASESKANSGLFVYDTTSGKTVKISDKSAHGMTVCGGKLYFLQSKTTYTKDYPAQDQAFDGRLYRYDGVLVTAVN